MAGPYYYDDADQVLAAIYAPQDRRTPATPAPGRPSSPQHPQHFDWRAAVVAGITAAVAGKLLDYLWEEHTR